MLRHLRKPDVNTNLRETEADQYYLCVPSRSLGFPESEIM